MSIPTIEPVSYTDDKATSNDIYDYEVMIIMIRDFFEADLTYSTDTQCKSVRRQDRFEAALFGRSLFECTTPHFLQHAASGRCTFRSILICSVQVGLV